MSPAANKDLRDTVTSPALRCLGNDIYEAWDQIAPIGRFNHTDSEKLIDFATSEAIPNGFQDWSESMRNRYL